MRLYSNRYIFKLSNTPLRAVASLSSTAVFLSLASFIDQFCLVISCPVLSCPALPNPDLSCPALSSSAPTICALSCVNHFRCIPSRIISYITLYYFVCHFMYPALILTTSPHLLRFYCVQYITLHSVIDENKEKLAQQYDLDGKTALDLALEEDIFSKDNISKDVVFTLFVDLFDEVYGTYDTLLLKRCCFLFKLPYPFLPNLPCQCLVHNCTSWSHSILCPQSTNRTLFLIRSYLLP